MGTPEIKDDPMVYSKQKLLHTVCKVLADHRRFLRVEQVIDDPQSCDRAALLRFDVERALSHHLEVAEQLSTSGVQGTFYFHTRRECYDPQQLKTFEALGHEVGFHHECLDRCRGDFDQARELFLREVDLFRKDGLDLRTVCSHGEAGLPKSGYRTNCDLFDRFPELLTQAGLKGEVYLWLREAQAHYASDTFSNYKGFWNTLTDANHDTSRPLMVLTHLHRWRNNPIVMMQEVAKDLARQASNRVRHQRGYQLAY